METLIHADIFFFIATIGFIIFMSVLIVALIYVVSLLRLLKRIVGKIEGNVEVISDEAKEFFLDLRDSKILSWVLGRKHRTHTKKQ